LQANPASIGLLVLRVQQILLDMAEHVDTTGTEEAQLFGSTR
jgi:hypothetical protein